MDNENEWISDDGSVRLICGDCLVELPKLEVGSIDCVVTSPPYNIGKKYSYYDDSKAESDYIEWLVFVLKQLSYISNDCVWINLGYRKLNIGNIPIVFQVWDKTDMFLMQAIKWEYDAGMTYRNRFNHRSEDWLWFVKDKNNYTFNSDSVRDISLTKHVTDNRNNVNGKLPSDVWYFPRVAGNSFERCEHPAQYPTKMIERILKSCTNKNSIGLDPFMGSGTTGVACVQTGRRFIGIEISRDYYEIAKKRIQTALMQMRMPGL